LSPLDGVGGVGRGAGRRAGLGASAMKRPIISNGFEEGSTRSTRVQLAHQRTSRNKKLFFLNFFFGFGFGCFIDNLIN